MTADAMSERIWWLSEDGLLDWCSPEHKATIKQFQAMAHWQRVHVLTDDELAARDRQVQAEALREAAVAMRTARRKSWTWTLPDPLDPEAAYSVDTWIEVRADRIEKGSDDER